MGARAMKNIFAGAASIPTILLIINSTKVDYLLLYIYCIYIVKQTLICYDAVL